MNSRVKFNKYPSVTSDGYLNYLNHWFSQTEELEYRSISFKESSWNDAVGEKYNFAVKKAYDNYSSALDREWDEFAKHREDFCPKEVFYIPKKEAIWSLRFEVVL